jgi:hypothetical protein
MNIIFAIWKYRKVLPTALRDLEFKREQQEHEDNRHRLNLCYKHRQEAKRSHYSEHNCDHCKALAEIEALHEQHIR